MKMTITLRTIRRAEEVAMATFLEEKNLQINEP